MNKRNKMFKLYLCSGVIIGIFVELINYDRIAGVGLLIYCLMMILFYHIYPTERRNLNQRSKE